jgi:hypothetical protein
MWNILSTRSLTTRSNVNSIAHCFHRTHFENYNYMSYIAWLETLQVILIKQRKVIVENQAITCLPGTYYNMTTVCNQNCCCIVVSYLLWQPQLLCCIFVQLHNNCTCFVCIFLQTSSTRLCILSAMRRRLDNQGVSGFQLSAQFFLSLKRIPARLLLFLHLCTVPETICALSLWQ